MEEKSEPKAELQKLYDFMFYETFYEDIQTAEKLYGKEAAKKFAMAILRFGVTREKSSPIQPGIDAVLEDIYAKIDKSRQNFERTAKYLESRKPKAARGVSSKAKNKSVESDILKPTVEPNT